MKKFFMIAVMALVTLTVSAQDKKFAVGVNVNYGMSSGYKQFGFGAKFQYEFIENFRAEASGNYFLKKDNINIWDANLNFHYLIPIGENLKVYPLVGVTLLGYKADLGGAASDAIAQAAAAAGMSVADFKAYAAQQGINLSQYESIGDVKETKIGINAGAGIEYYLSESFKLNLEAKYQYTKIADWPVISIGAAYCF